MEPVGKRFAIFERLTSVALGVATVVVTALGCSGYDSVDPGTEEIATSSEALTTAEIWGFENATGWTVTSGSGTKTTSTTRNEGALSLAITAPGFIAIRGDAVAKPPALGPLLAFDVMIPTQIGPYYYGAVQMSVSSTSLNINNQWVNQRELSVPTGVWRTLTFQLTNEIYQKLLTQSFNDLQVTIGLNVPAGVNQPFRLDNLRFLAVPSCVGQPNGTLCDDLTACTVGSSCISGTCGTVTPPPPGSACDPGDDVMGFENFPAWQVATASAALAPNTTTRVQGQRSLQINTPYFTTVSSINLATLHKVGSTLSLRVQKPTHQPNAGWHGDLTLAMSVPSLGINFSQAKPLTGQPNGSFFELTFQVPASTVQLLASSTYNDLKFSVSISPPNGQNGFYLLDDLHFVPVMSCSGVANKIACEDDSLCTQGDSCQGGMCGVPVVCNDANVCTNDSCNPATGCVFTPNTATCEDGNACTTGDQCGGGVCLPGGPTDCNDGNTCTDDTCVAPTGCVHAANTATCNDGDVCTGAAPATDSCSGGACVGGPPLNCDDGSNCTVDSCVNPTGCVQTSACGPTGVCVANNCCQPKTCTDLHVECGVHDDGCGGTVDCNSVCPSGGSCNPAFQCLPPNEYSEPSGLNVCEVLLEDMIIPAVTAEEDQCLDFDAWECATGIGLGHPLCCIPGSCFLDPVCYVTKTVVVVAEQVLNAGDLYCAFRSPDEYLMKLLNGSISTAEQWAAFLQTGGLTGLVDFEVALLTNAGRDIPDNVKQVIQDLTAPVYDGGATGFEYDDMDNVKIVSSAFPTAGLWLPGGRTAITLGPVIVLQANLYDALVAGSNSGVSYSEFVTDPAVCDTYIMAVDILIHELVHVHQYAELGSHNFYTQYVGSVADNGYGGAEFEVDAFDYQIGLSELQGGNHCAVTANVHKSRIDSLGLPIPYNTCTATGPDDVALFPSCP